MRLSPLVLAAAAASVLAVGAARAEPRGDRPFHITLTGEGVATAAPDIAVITTGVVTRAANAGEALKANAEAMTKVIAALKDAKIAEKDFGTSGLTVQPQYDYSDGRAPTLTGYEVRNAVTIRAREIDRLGGLLDTLVAAGSNQIDGLAFEVSNSDAKLDEARRAAVADAKRKAELYAASAGVTLGKVESIEENETQQASPRPLTLRMQAKDASAPTPIVRGEQEMRVEVRVRWAIQP
ncbi:SIMPL domain-containing protein [Methylopila musalis]|uniref:SIMPL domain-containing protein n=1 Tax=Methylopila musalis TaxID=1134781 RepID=A0ABW3Z950_9HYPH